MQRERRIVQIIIDDREANTEVTRVLQEMEGVEVTVQRLSLGDYQIDGKLLVERKTLFDLAASIKDGRLFEQACKLASNPMRSVVILEGTAEDLTHSRMSREAIQGALITITIILGIPLLRSRDAQESARLLLYAARQMGTIPFRSFQRKGKRPKGKRALQLRLLQDLPGIGPERANRLLEAFGSIEAVVTMPADRLAVVNGIGFKTARKIRWAVSP
ncbi:MAG: ERCC4 domain-containing protein [bacterium]